METRLGIEINKEALRISKIYGINLIEAQIILMKGITIYQDYMMGR